MTGTDSNEMTYRFATFAARGTIWLRHDSVRTKTRTHLGWWEQTIPLADLRPQYGTLRATPQVFLWACIFALVFAGTGIYGLFWGAWAIPQKSVSILLLATGLFLGRYLLKYRKSEWIIFNAYDEGGRVGYTRQGPDACACDAFTERLVGAIRKSRAESSDAADRRS
ncbi:hypothetical protein K227x_17130 [Rubripirellula lacrimiformis]|uniref:Uncharacterized protein n=1 Tax=Rubripirellula lacrimiformis TaxID=1930273 RepID=A0A517N878_9BACT|nr:hypothetical protein K227x_17130 [Rubripirellula lacrimiformis]